MKAIKLLTVFTLFFTVLNLTSCATSDEPVDPAVLAGPSPATFKADFDGTTFEASTVNAIVNDDYIAITGMKSTGEFFQITIPEPVLGTYVWDDFDPSDVGFGLAYSGGSGSVPYIGARDDSGTFASFANYTDTAEINITSIDAVNKKISGTFHFTGVKYADGSVTTVVTKEFTNGAFTNVSYGEPDTTPTGTSFAVKLDGATYTATNINAIAIMDRISLSAVRGSVETIGFSVPQNVVPGTYTFGMFGDYVGQYNLSSTEIFASSTGSITITSHNTSTKKIKGTFNFTATPITGGTPIHEITQGSFDITYL